MGDNKKPKKVSTRAGSEKALAGAYFLLACASVLAIFFIPAWNQGAITESAYNLDEYVLQDRLHDSLYRMADRSGDTNPSLTALGHAVNILGKEGSISNAEKVAAYLEHIEDNIESTQDINNFVSASKHVGALSPAKSEFFYGKLLDLIEPDKGFIPGEHSLSSVKSTFQALSAISTIGKFDKFKSSKKFERVISFVRAAKHGKNESFGYVDTKGAGRSISATYFAHKILSEFNEVSSTDFEGVLPFIASCQAADGGFLNHEVHNSFELFYESGTLEHTAQAFSLITTLDSVDPHSLFLALDSREVYSAISFVRACVSVNTVKSTPNDYFGNIAATDAYLSLVHGSIDSDTPRNIQVGLVGLALFFFSLSLYNIYKDKLARARGFNFHHVVSGSCVFLLATAGTLFFFPSFTILPLVLLTGFLLRIFYDNLEDLFRTGEDTVLSLALGGSTIYGGFLFLCFYLSPHAFTMMPLYYILVLWGAVGAFVAFVIARQFLANTKPQSFYYSAATMTWVLNTLILYSLLYARGMVSIVHNLILISGNFFSVYVALPVSSLILIYIAVHTGNTFYPAPLSVKK